jgi:sodium transport system permease protein
LAWRSGSVVPGIVVHFCHNGLLLMLVYYRDELMARGWGLEQQQHLPALWLIAASIALAIGAGVLYFAGPPPRPTIPT